LQRQAAEDKDRLARSEGTRRLREPAARQRIYNPSYSNHELYAHVFPLQPLAGGRPTSRKLTKNIQLGLLAVVNDNVFISSDSSTNQRLRRLWYERWGR